MNTFQKQLFYWTHMLDESFRHELNEKKTVAEYAMDLELEGKTIPEAFEPTIDHVTYIQSADFIRLIDNHMFSRNELIDQYPVISTESRSKLDATLNEWARINHTRPGHDLWATTPIYDLNFTEDDVHQMDLSDYDDDVAAFMVDQIENATHHKPIFDHANDVCIVSKPDGKLALMAIFVSDNGRQIYQYIKQHNLI